MPPSDVKSAQPVVRASNGAAPSRCRLRVVCDGTTTGLALRRIRDGGSVRPTLCCDACAAGRVAP